MGYLKLGMEGGRPITTIKLTPSCHIPPSLLGALASAANPLYPSLSSTGVAEAEELKLALMLLLLPLLYDERALSLPRLLILALPGREACGVPEIGVSCSGDGRPSWCVRIR